VTYPSTAIDKIAVELHLLAEAYAAKAVTLANDPYFKEAVMKVSVSGFVWALYHAFDDPLARDALKQELKIQSAAVERVLSSATQPTH
jgi:hypothetical protein